MRTLFSILTILAIIAAAHAQPATAADEKITVIRAGTIITVSGETITDGAIVIIDGTIELVGRQLDYPRNATIIDARDKVVMPGLIHAHTRHGLQNLNRNGVNGNLTVEDELYWDTMDMESLIEHGITAIAFYPGGSSITGMASAYATGGHVDARLLDITAYLNVTMDSPARDKPQMRAALKKAREEIEKIKKAKEEWDQKQQEAAEKAQLEAEQKQNDNGGNGNGNGNGRNNTRQDDGGAEQAAAPAEFTPPQTDATVQPLMDLIEKKADFVPLISIGGASDLLHLNDVIKDEEFEWRLIVNNARSTDFHNAMDQLKEHGGLMLTEPGLSTITQTSTRYNLPAALERAGCDVAFMPAGTSDRQLGGYLAMVADNVRSGMGREAALRAMTLNAAKIIGADAKIGSIDKGKRADLIILDGDPLNPLTKIERVMINGETVHEAEGDK